MSIWFEIWGSWIQIKKIDFSRHILEQIRFVQAILQKKFDFPGNFPEISTFLVNFLKLFDFPGKNLPIYSNFWASYILFLFKSHYFRTFFLCMIIFHDPPATPRPSLLKIWGSRPPKPPGLTLLLLFSSYLLQQIALYQIEFHISCLRSKGLAFRL